MNWSSCSGLLHCHYQWVTCILMNFFLLCASPFGAGMPNPGERLGFNLVCKKCSPQNYKRGGGKIRVGGSCPKYPPPQISPVFPRFPPVFPPFSPVFPLFSPVFPRFPPFFPVFPCYWEPNADCVWEPWTPEERLMAAVGVGVGGRGNTCSREVMSDGWLSMTHPPHGHTPMARRPTHRSGPAPPAAHTSSDLRLGGHLLMPPAQLRRQPQWRRQSSPPASPMAHGLQPRHRYPASSEGLGPPG